MPALNRPQILKWFGAAVITVGLVLPAAAEGLSRDAEGALLAALNDEYHAQAVYDATIAKFGPVRPFVNIARAERQHEAMVIDLMNKYGIEVPPNPYETGTSQLDPLPPTLQQTCAMGVEAEKLNRDLYHVQLLPRVANYPDITLVLTRLSDASEYRHLPAFQRCAI